jgi:hypothetical protein
MTEEERIKAVSKLAEWRRRDSTVGSMVLIVCAHHDQPDVGHLARYEPDVFDELYEEAEAMMLNPGDD